MSRLATFRESDLKRAIRVFEAMGKTVTGASIGRDGTISVLTGVAAAASVDQDEYENWKSKRGDRGA